MAICTYGANSGRVRFSGPRLALLVGDGSSGVRPAAVSILGDLVLQFWLFHALIVKYRVLLSRMSCESDVFARRWRR